MWKQFALPRSHVMTLESCLTMWLTSSLSRQSGSFLAILVASTWNGVWIERLWFLGKICTDFSFPLKVRTTVNQRLTKSPFANCCHVWNITIINKYFFESLVNYNSHLQKRLDFLRSCTICCNVTVTMDTIEYFYQITQTVILWQSTYFQLNIRAYKKGGYSYKLTYFTW